MVQYYKTDNGRLSELEGPEGSGIWIKMTDPTGTEARKVADSVGADFADVFAAMDDDESSRIELQDGYTLILVDIPVSELRQDRNYYTTIPLGIILTQDVLVTICSEETPILTFFEKNLAREFSTKKKLRFVYQILFRAAMEYQSCLRVIDKKRTEIEERIDKETKENDLVALHHLESNLVYFSTSLGANKNVIDRLTRYKRLKQFPEDQELLDDVIVENNQALEMAAIYRDIINGTRELMSNVIDSRLNNVMKILTSVTLVMAIPTIISGFYGMNVAGISMPLSDHPHGFGIICILTTLICILIMWLLHRKKML
ncbi:MAG: magnesium transporter CorA family protein [Lachnospiraceae bacterium]|nr:magnesium transporter CorA family protein [Lachnospiraceae bacterium]